MLDPSQIAALPDDELVRLERAVFSKLLVDSVALGEVRREWDALLGERNVRAEANGKAEL